MAFGEEIIEDLDDLVDMLDGGVSLEICKRKAKRIGEKMRRCETWQDEERTETSVEQVYKTRIDCPMKPGDEPGEHGMVEQVDTLSFNRG